VSGGQPITLPEGEAVIGSDGVIATPDGEVGTLAVVDLPAGATWRRKTGNNQFLAESNATAAPVADPQVRQGFLEQANVDMTAQFTEMLSVLRVYEAAQRLLELQDASAQTTAKDIGQV